jgi:ATPase subunit of ABC transporter with duplicated ATPase domains
MEALGCPPGDWPVDNLSGGEKRRVALCQLLLRKSPTCCCSTSRPTISTPRPSWLEKHLREYPGAVLIITHDRYFLDNVTGWILELDRGRGIPLRGQLLRLSASQGQALEQEEREEDRPPEGDRKSCEWISASPKARQTKSKARIKAYDELVKSRQQPPPARRRSSFRLRSGSAARSSTSKPVQGLW